MDVARGKQTTKGQGRGQIVNTIEADTSLRAVVVEGGLEAVVHGEEDTKAGGERVAHAQED